jgi:hypothetical protein
MDLKPGRRSPIMGVLDTSSSFLHHRRIAELRSAAAILAE